MSRATISDSVAADRLRDRDNAAGIGDNSEEIGDKRRDRRYSSECYPMLNSSLNRDWSNSVPGRQIPEGTQCE